MRADDWGEREPRRGGRFGARKGRRGGRGDKPPEFGGPPLTREDRRSVREFIRTRQGVEAYIEPGSITNPLSVVFVANDGESRRFRIPNMRFIEKLSRRQAIPVYDASRTGYPKRMKEYRAKAPGERGEEPRQGRTGRGGGWGRSRRPRLDSPEDLLPPDERGP